MSEMLSPQFFGAVLRAEALLGPLRQRSPGEIAPASLGKIRSSQQC